MKNKNYYHSKSIIFLTFGIFLLTMVIFPLVLKIPLVKSTIIYLLSFTTNEGYQVAYVEFIGAIIGSFMAICGSMWLQGRKEQKAETNRRKKYACIVYNDLDLAFKDLIKIFRDTEIRHGLKTINGEEDANVFCEVAVGRKIHLSPNWISDVAQLNDMLSRTEIQTVYKYYGLLLDIDRAFQSGKTDEIKKIYSTHIGYLVTGNQRKVHSDCQLILDKLSKLAKDG